MLRAFVLVSVSILVSCSQAVGEKILDSVRYLHYRPSCQSAVVSFEQLLSDFKVTYSLSYIEPEAGVLPQFRFDEVLVVNFNRDQEKLASLAIDGYKMLCGPNGSLTPPEFFGKRGTILSTVEASPVGKNHNGDFLIQEVSGELKIFVTRKNFD